MLITLGGRNFDGAPRVRSADQDEYIADQLRLAGVLEVTQGRLARTKGLSADDVFTQILVSGRKSFVLAGCLTEQGKLWTCAEADFNAGRFAAITDPSQKAAMQSYIAEFCSSVFPEAK